MANASRGHAADAARLIVERHAEAFFFAPDDMAAPGAAVRGYGEHEAVRKPDRALDLDRSTRRRDIADHAIDLAAAELDRPGFQDTVARGSPSFVHQHGA